MNNSTIAIATICLMIASFTSGAVSGIKYYKPKPIEVEKVVYVGREQEKCEKAGGEFEGKFNFGFNKVNNINDLYIGKYTLIGYKCTLPEKTLFEK